jgi:hypothetical protein
MSKLVSNSHINIRKGFKMTVKNNLRTEALQSGLKSKVETLKDYIPSN